MLFTEVKLGHVRCGVTEATDRFGLKHSNAVGYVKMRRFNRINYP